MNYSGGYTWEKGRSIVGGVGYSGPYKVIGFELPRVERMQKLKNISRINKLLNFLKKK